MMNELVVEEVDPERFARLIDLAFMRSQSDDWVNRFYAFMNDQPALWRRKYTGSEEAILRTKPIIRLDDGRHTMPFDIDDKPLAFLPSSNPAIGNYFPTVSSKVSKDARSRQFLEGLGLKPPDIFDAILNDIMPLYERFNLPDTPSNNKQHVVSIAKAVSEIKNGYHDRKTELLHKVDSTKFILARNIVSGQIVPKADRYLCELRLYRKF